MEKSREANRSIRPGEEELKRKKVEVPQNWEWIDAMAVRGPETFGSHRGEKGRLFLGDSGPGRGVRASVEGQLG